MLVCLQKSAYSNTHVHGMRSQLDLVQLTIGVGVLKHDQRVGPAVALGPHEPREHPPVRACEVVKLCLVL